MIHWFLPGGVMSERVRTTISVDPDVLATFKRLADLGQVSVGRFIGDWLSDTADGAEHVALELSRAKEASRGVLRDLHVRLGVSEVRSMVAAAAQDVQGAQRPVRPAQGSGQDAPSSNTGLKSSSAGEEHEAGHLRS